MRIFTGRTANFSYFGSVSVKLADRTAAKLLQCPWLRVWGGVVLFALGVAVSLHVHAVQSFGQEKESWVV